MYTVEVSLVSTKTLSYFRMLYVVSVLTTKKVSMNMHKGKEKRITMCHYKKSAKHRTMEEMKNKKL